MPNVAKMTKAEFARCLEYTIVPQRDCKKWLEYTAALVREYKFGCFFIAAEMLDEVVRELGDFCRENKVEIGVSNSGLGDTNSNYSLKDKLRKGEYYFKHGATELDYVINIAELKNGEYDTFKKDILENVKLCHSYGAPIKVLHEAGKLTDEEIRTSSKICIECGVDYIKTSSGFTVNPRTDYRQCSIMLDEIKKSGTDYTKLKASSGVVENVLAFIQMGASRCGSNIAMKILDNFSLLQEKLFIHSNKEV